MKNFQILILIICIPFFECNKAKVHSHRSKGSANFGCARCGHKTQEKCLNRISGLNLSGYAYFDEEEEDTVTPYATMDDPTRWNFDFSDCLTELDVRVKPQALCIWNPIIGCILLGYMPIKNNVTTCAKKCAYSGLCPCGLKKRSSGNLSTIPHLFLQILVLFLYVCQC